MSSLALPRELLRWNLESPAVVPADELRTMFADLTGRPVGDRIARWASFFLSRAEAVYRFGDTDGGYVTRGLLADDLHTDCVLFAMRCVELGVSRSPEEALATALARRFPGADPGEVILEDGRVDYTHPLRLDGRDVPASGAYGTDVTPTVGPVVGDTGEGSDTGARLAYVRSADVDLGRLKSGDVVHCVLDPDHPEAAETRRRSGSPIGHMGIARVTPDCLLFIHAASHDLPGAYAGGRIASVSLPIYLSRVERFAGILVTRLPDD